MPKYWYNYKACEGDKFLQSICVDKKPYFMTYIYDDYRQKLLSFLKETETTALVEYKTELKILLNKINLNKKEKKFIEYYNSKYPFGTAGCAMNRICNYIELAFMNYVPRLKKGNDFDYTFLLSGIVYDEDKYNTIAKLQEDYVSYNTKIKGYKYTITSDTEEVLDSKEQLNRYIRQEIKEICPDEDERTDILLDLHYRHGGNNQFFWSCAGKYIIERLEKMVYGDL